MTNFLDSKILENFRKIYSSNGFFHRDPIQKEKFDLICAIMDRVSTCINELNTYENTPKSEEDLIVFMVFGVMLVDAVEKLLKVLFPNDYKKPNSQIFKDICVKYNLKFDSNYSEDDSFFRFLRVLIFAHPFGTGDRTENEKCIYSPFLLVNHFSTEKDHIGIMLYTKGEYGDKILEIPFHLLKDYLKNQYELIKLCFEQLVLILENKKQEWKQHKINRDGPPIDVIRNIISILKERYVDYDLFETLLCYLKTETTVDSNKKVVSKFKDAVKRDLPNICNAIDVLDHEKAFSIVSSYYHPIFNTEDNFLYYSLSKILSSANDKKHFMFKYELKRFYNNFAKKWVIIDIEYMDLNEIKLLVNVACYCEKVEQEKGIDNK